MLSIVFALLAHRHTAGLDDGSGNPLRVAGAGWAGFAGFQSSDLRSTGASIARFSTLADGCRAAAVEWHSVEFRAVQAAYRSGDPAGLASAIEASPSGCSPDLTGLTAELAAFNRAAGAAGGLHGVLRRLRAVAPRRSVLSPGRD